MFSVKAAAIELGISGSKCYELCQKRKLSHYKIKSPTNKESSGLSVSFADRTVNESFLVSTCPMKLFSVRETAERSEISRSLMCGPSAVQKIRHKRRGLGHGTIKIPTDALEDYRKLGTVEMKDVRKGDVV
jgi:hypothetical protein